MSLGKTRVLNIIQYLSLGGAARAMIAASKYMTKQSEVSHDVVSLLPPEPDAISFAEAEGLNFIKTTSSDDIFRLIPQYDIIQVQWWNNAELNSLFREKLPPCRLVLWCHVGGHTIPQVIPESLVHYADYVVACSPHTYNCPTLSSLSPEIKKEKVGMAYGAADFARITDVSPKPHSNFNVGYIGTLDYSKMHPRYFEMSEAVHIPEVRFILAGGGVASDDIRSKALVSGCAEKYDIRGYVNDIVPLLNIFDVYGYPLCEDNYSGSEINLQEVMYAAIPPVVFPYGGIQHLVVNDFTGIVVHSESEYSEAIEHLYHHPEERRRLGKNAEQYAKQIFGAEHAAEEFLKVYEKVLSKPIVCRRWGSQIQEDAISCTLTPEIIEDTYEQPIGSLQFIDSLGIADPGYRTTCEKTIPVIDLLEADTRVSSVSKLVRDTIERQYLRLHPEDPYLLYWCGLMYINAEEPERAIQYFDAALMNGFSHWRIWCYIYSCANRSRRNDIAVLAQTKILELNIEKNELDSLSSFLEIELIHTLDSNAHYLQKEEGSAPDIVR